MGESTKKSQIELKKLIAMLVAFAFAFGFRFLPTIPGLTPVGMEVIGAFIGMLIGWLCVDLASGSILALLAMALSSYTDAPKEFMISFLGNSTTFTVMGVLMLAALLRANKLEKVILFKMMSLKFVKGKPYAIFTVWMITYFLITQFAGSGPIGIFIILPLFFELFKQAGWKKGDKQIVAFFLGMLLTAGCATIDLPIQGMGIVFMGLMANMNVPITALTYTAYALPISMLLIFGYIFYCKFIWRIDFSVLADTHMEVEQVIMTKQQKASLILFLLTLLGMLLGSIPIPGLSIFYTLGNMGVVFVGIFLGMIIPVEGKPIIRIQEIGAHFEWTMFFFAAAVSVMPGALASEATGIRTLLIGILSPIAAQTNDFTIIIFGIVATTLLTNFISNSVAGVLMITICATMAAALPDMNLMLVICMVMFACEFGFMTPMASGTAACLCALSQWVSVKDMMISGIFLAIWCALLLGVFGSLWSNVIF